MTVAETELSPSELAAARRQIAREERERSEERGQELLVTLSRLRRGDTIRQLADALAEVIAGVRTHQRSGAVTLKLAVAPMKGAGTVLTVVDTVTAKVPTGDRPVQVAWATDRDGISVDQPDQIAIIPRDQLGGH